MIIRILYAKNYEYRFRFLEVIDDEVANTVLRHGVQKCNTVAARVCVGYTYSVC